MKNLELVELNYVKSVNTLNGEEYKKAKQLMFKAICFSMPDDETCTDSILDPFMDLVKFAYDEDGLLCVNFVCPDQSYKIELYARLTGDEFEEYYSCNINNEFNDKEFDDKYELQKYVDEKLPETEVGILSTSYEGFDLVITNLSV